MSEYPKLLQIKKELNLLQKLYGLYNNVIDTVHGYYDILWQDVNIEKINNELQEFQNRSKNFFFSFSFCQPIPKVTCFAQHKLLPLVEILSSIRYMLFCSNTNGMLFFVAQ